MNAIELDGVHRSFGDLHAVRGLDLTVAKGRVLGLLGTNGAGKTTCLRMMAGLLPPDRGDVRVQGFDPWSAAADDRRRVAYLPETDFPFPELTFQEAVAFTSRLTPRWDPDTLEQVQAVLQVPLGRPYSSLSRGWQRKFFLALTLATTPELLLLDDPAQGVDVTVRRDLIRVLQPLLARGNATVVFSSHVFSDVERLADSVAVIDAGRVCLTGDLDDLKERAVRVVDPDPAVVRELEVLRVETVQGTAQVTALARDASQVEQLRESGLPVHTVGLEDLFLAVVQRSERVAA